MSRPIYSPIAHGLLVGSAAWICLASSTAAADELVADNPPAGIYGGSEVDTCGWPSVAYLTGAGSACTGALIHPQIVLTAAHCLEGNVAATVRFGEIAASAQKKAETEFCRANPGWTGDLGTGEDYGFCKLETPVAEVPHVPVLFGCETDVLHAGREVVHVGFGVDQNGQSGRKKELWTDIEAIAPGEIITGGGGNGICSGDSGGPTFVRLPNSQGGDNSWRVAGIHSWSQDPCGGTSGSVIASQAVAWIEQQSGVDVTPCYTASGGWDPTWECQGFPKEPWVGGGSYLTGCEPGPLASFSGVCGAPLDANPDEVAPSVEILEPTTDVMVEISGTNPEVHVEAIADDGNGWGLDRLELVVHVEDTGEEFTQVDDVEPFTWDAAFPPGAYFIKVQAFDHAQNRAETDWVAVGVGVAPPEDPPDDGGDSGDDGSSDGTSSGGGADGGESIRRGGQSEDACACRTDSPTPTPLSLGGLLVLSLAGRSPRTRCRSR